MAGKKKSKLSSKPRPEMLKIMSAKAPTCEGGMPTLTISPNELPEPFRSFCIEAMRVKQAEDFTTYVGIPLMNAVSEEEMVKRGEVLPSFGPYKAACPSDMAAAGNDTYLDLRKFVYKERELRQGRLPLVFEYPFSPPVTLQEVEEYIYKKFAIRPEWHEYSDAIQDTLFTKLPLAATGRTPEAGYNCAFYQDLSWNRLADGALRLSGFPVKDVVSAEELAKYSAKTLAPPKPAEAADLPSEEMAQYLGIQNLVYKEQEYRHGRTPIEFPDLSKLPVTLKEASEFLYKKLAVEPVWYCHDGPDGKKLFAKLPLDESAGFTPKGYNTVFFP